MPTICMSALLLAHKSVSRRELIHRFQSRSSLCPDRGMSIATEGHARATFRRESRGSGAGLCGATKCAVGGGAPDRERKTLNPPHLRHSVAGLRFAEKKKNNNNTKRTAAAIYDQ